MKFEHETRQIDSVLAHFREEEGELAIHPLKTRPNGVNVVVLWVAEKAPHGLVLAPGVLQTRVRALPPSEGRPEGSPHTSQRLRGLKPDPSQRGHSSPSCRKHSTNSGDSCAERAKLVSVIGGPPCGPGLGVLVAPPGPFFVYAPYYTIHSPFHIFFLPISVLFTV